MVDVRYRVIWTPFDEKMKEALLRPTPGPIWYDGAEVAAFEREVAGYLGTEHAVAVSSGTAALHVALVALGIGPGDEVITGANSYVCIPECILRVGARPVYCDVSEATANMDVTGVEPLVTSKTRAIAVVHYYGHPVDMDPIIELARKRGIFVIEDAAHAMGGEYKGRKLGSLGDVGFASFARKCLTVAGQAGMAFTSDSELAGRMTLLRRHGWNREDPRREHVALVGFNYTLNEGQAAVGRVSLRRLERNRAMRDRNALRYVKGLADRGVPARPFELMPWARHGRLHFVVRVPRRDELLDFLGTRGIVAAVHYRWPPYRQPAYVARTGEDPGPRPITDRLAEEIITLPSHPDMDAAGLDYVMDQVAEFYD